MEYSELQVDKFLTSRIPPMLVGKLLGARNSMDMRQYPADSYTYTKYFLERVDGWIKSFKLNSITNLDSFKFKNAIIGVSQQIDELHYLYGNRLVIFEGEYAYHWRLNPNILRVTHHSQIPAGAVLVISVPSVRTAGNVGNIDEILEYCNNNNIEVHIDAAWFGQCRNINLDVGNTAIRSFSMSLSKSFSMGSQRIGIRYTRNDIHGPISIMNKFGYNNVSDMWIGCHMIDTFGVDFWWKNYSSKYHDVCKDFDLIESDSINIAFKDNIQVSIRTPLRLLIDNKFDARGYDV